MITIEETKDTKLITHVMTEPQLWKLLYGNSGRLVDTYTVDNTLTYLVAKKDETVIGLIPYRPVHGFIVEMHIAILPKFWGKRIILKALKKMGEYMYQKFGIFYIPVPMNCVHILKFIEKFGFKSCGIIKNSTIYRNELVDTLLVSVTIEDFLLNVNKLLK